MTPADQLARAAEGDTESFLAFYDATSSCAFTLALQRAHARGLRGCVAHDSATRDTESWYVLAWARSGEQASSGLSPLAWLLALTAPGDEAACA